MDDTDALYAKIRDQVLRDAKEQATQVYNTLGTKYGVASVPTHTHNGVDSVVLDQANITTNQKYAAGYGTAMTETVYLRYFQNPTRLCFYGAANNNTQTKLATINGETVIGRTFIFNGASTYNTITNIPGIPFVSICNYIYIDTAALINTTLGPIGNFIAYVNDGTNTLASIAVTRIDQGFITLNTVVAANWEITGNFLLT